MLTIEEQKFIDYWQANRTRQKRTVKQLMIGLPFGVIFVIAIFINFVSGWDKQAQMVMNKQSSLFLVLLATAIIIVVFVSVFSIRHRWDLNEQRYKELLAKKNK